MSSKILIVDDEPAIAEILALRLRQAGYEVFVAESGPSGLEIAAAERPAVILLDIRMPAMDGIEVNRLLKENPETSKIDVIFVAANVKDAIHDGATTMEAKAYISKPYNHEVVIKTLRELEAARSRKGLAAQNGHRTLCA